MKQAVVMLIALVLPVQGLVSAAMKLRGPAHFHPHETSAADRAHPRHAHEGVGHHHHASDEGAIEVDDDSGHHHADQAGGEIKRAWIGALDALTPATFARPPDPSASAIVPRLIGQPPSSPPGRPYRPPDSSAAFFLG